MVPNSTGHGAREGVEVVVWQAEVTEGLVDKVRLQQRPALEEVRERTELTPRGRQSHTEPEVCVCLPYSGPDPTAGQV